MYKHYRMHRTTGRDVREETGLDSRERLEDRLEGRLLSL